MHDPARTTLATLFEFGKPLREVRFPPKADISQFDQIRRSVMCASKSDFRYSDQIKRVPPLSSGIGPGLSARMSPVCGSMRR